MCSKIGIEKNYACYELSREIKETINVPENVLIFIVRV